MPGGRRPFAQLPVEGLSNDQRAWRDLDRPPRLYENEVYTSAINFATVLGLDSLTDGIYQPADPVTGKYARQSFFHSCGDTDNDTVTIPTTEPSKLYVNELTQFKF